MHKPVYDEPRSELRSVKRFTPSKDGKGSVEITLTKNKTNNHRQLARSVVFDLNANLYLIVIQLYTSALVSIKPDVLIKHLITFYYTIKHKTARRRLCIYSRISSNTIVTPRTLNPIVRSCSLLTHEGYKTQGTRNHISIVFDCRR